MSTTTTNVAVSVVYGENNGKLLVSRDGVTTTVTTIRPRDRAAGVAGLLTTLVNTRPSYLLPIAGRTDGDLTGLRRTALAAYADGLAARPAATAHNPRFEAPALAHQLGSLLRDADAPVHAAVRNVVAELFDDIPDTLVVANIADYTDDIHTTVDIGQLLADATTDELVALLSSSTWSGTTPTDTAPFFDYLTGDALTALERAVSRITATGSPTYVEVSERAVRRWLAGHRPDVLAELDTGYGR